MTKRQPIISMCFAVLAASIFFLIRGHIRYAGVEDWPSVKALDVTFTGQVLTYPVETVTGSRTTTIDTRQVRFRYYIGGVEYFGTRATPDGPHGPHSSNASGPWRAFYNPSNPDIAVLSPQPFRGETWIIVGTFSGFMVAVTLIFDLLHSERKKG